MVSTLGVFACSLQTPALEQVLAWGPATATVTEAHIRAELADPVVGSAVVPLADPNVRVVGTLAGPGLLFALIVAQPAAGGLGPHDCMLVFVDSKIVDHFCQVDGEFLIHVSTIGFVAAPIYDVGVTSVRLTVCGEHRWERPHAGFVVFALDDRQAASAFALEVFRGTHRVSLSGSKAAIQAKTCTPIS